MSAKVRIVLSQKSPKENDGLLQIFFREYKISGNASNIELDVPTICKKMAELVEQRIKAEARGLSNKFKISRPFKLSIVWNNKTLIDTEKLSVTTGTQDMIKVKSAKYKKNPVEEMQRFADSIQFIIESGQELDKSLRKCFKVKLKKKKEEQPTEAAKEATKEAEKVATSDNATNEETEN